jgi:hypothetical protein
LKDVLAAGESSDFRQRERITEIDVAAIDRIGVGCGGEADNEGGGQ